MVEFFTTLGAIVILAVSAAVPGFVAGQAERGLRDRFPGATPQVHVEAEPFLQLPRGHIARLVLDLDGAVIGPLAIPDLSVEATDLHLPPGALWGFAPPELLAPAPVRVRFGGSAEAWRTSLARAVGAGRLDDLALPKNPLGIGAGADASSLALTFEPGRLGATLQAPGKAGAVLDLRVSFEPKISADGRRLTMGEPRAQIGETEVPQGLLRLFGAAPLMDLGLQELPGRDWRFAALRVGTDGLWVELTGVLDRLPKK